MFDPDVLAHDDNNEPAPKYWWQYVSSIEEAVELIRSIPVRLKTLLYRLGLYTVALAVFVCFGFGPSDALAAQIADGTGDGWQIDNPNKGNVSTYSVCAWIKPTASPASNASLFGYGNGTASSGGTGWNIILQTDMKIRWLAYSAGSTFQATSSLTLTAGSWQHVCFVREGLFAHKIYVDATDSTSDESLAVDPGTTIASTDDFVVAQGVANDFAGYANYTGGLAQVAYYDAALTGSEVASLANKGTCPDAIATHSANLQVFLKMTDGASVTDSSANAFTVTESGNPTDDTGPGSLACDSGGTTTTTSTTSTTTSTTTATTTAATTTTTSVSGLPEIPCNGLDEDSSGGDLACTDDSDSDGDGYDDSHDCEVNDPWIYPGVEVATGCSGSDYKTCQSDGSYTTCQTGPLCEKTGSGHCYYVDPLTGNDSNPGTYASPWATLNNFSYYSSGAPATAVSPTPGDVLYLVGSGTLSATHTTCYGGSYRCGFSTYNRNGTSSNHYMLRRYPGSSVVINTGLSSATPGFAIEYYYSDYWDFKDLEVTGGYGSLISGGEGVSNVTFERIYAHDNDGDANNNLTGIMLNGVDTATISHSRIKDICDSSATSTVKWFNVRSIGLFESSNVSVHHNLIWHTLATSAAGNCKGRGIGQKHGLPAAQAGNNHIYANKLWNNYDNIGVCSANTETDHNLVVCGSQDDHGYLELSGNGGSYTYHYLKNENVHHNTFYGCLGPTLDYESGARNSTYIGGNSYQDNVVYSSRSSYDRSNSLFTICPDVACSNTDYTAIHSAGLNTINNNCYFAGSTTGMYSNFGAASAGGVHTFGTWQSTDQHDGSGYQEDPQLDAQFAAQSSNCSAKGYTEGSMLEGTTSTTSVSTTTTSVAVTTTTVSSSGSTATGKPGAFDRIRRQ